ncbi:MAG TPA: MarR family transcriptional regulator [Myxococcales bacterium]|nr:MarR family transcriptional regulator [Myxococcales bacterium]
MRGILLASPEKQKITAKGMPYHGGPFLRNVSMLDRPAGRSYLPRQMLPQQEYVGLLIGAARRSIKQAVLRKAKPLRLTPPQFWFLNAAREMPNATVGEIARRQRFDPPTASRLAESLAGRGLLRMAADPRDRRAVRVTLSLSGMKLAERIGTIAAWVRAQVVQGMSAREQEALRSSLRKVIRNLDEAGE